MPSQPVEARNPSRSLPKLCKLFPLLIRAVVGRCSADPAAWSYSCRARPPPPLPPAPIAVTPTAGDAVIVEPRALRRLPFVLRNVWGQLPRGSWSMHLVHGQHISSQLRHAAVRSLLVTGKLHLRRLDHMLDAAGIWSADNLTGRAWYNKMLLSSAFWGSFQSPLLLLFEADSVLCPSPSRPLHTFAGYGFVGAPWAPYYGGWFPFWCRNLAACVGNSGLSLWARPILQNLTSRPPSAYEDVVASYLRISRGSATKRGMGSTKALYSHKGNLTFSSQLIVHIDVWVSVLLQSLQHAGALPALAGPAVPSDTIASRFSVETLYAETNAAAWVPFGVHKPHAYLPTAQLEQLYARCPPARELARLMNDSKLDVLDARSWA